MFHKYFWSRRIKISNFVFLPKWKIWATTLHIAFKVGIANLLFRKVVTHPFFKGGEGVYCFGENLTFSNCFILILRQKRVLFWYQWWSHSSEQKEKQQPFLLSSEKNKNFAQKQKHPKLLKQCHELKDYLLNSSQAFLPKTTHEFIIKSK